MSEDTAAGAHARVLVVDDEADILELVREVLSDEGYDVDTALTGEAALAITRERRPDLILLDVKLPGADGWEVLAELRAAAGPQTPVVVMTAGFDAQDRALGGGAQGYLAKPFELDDLLSAVEAHAGLRMQGGTEEAITGPGHTGR